MAAERLTIWAGNGRMSPFLVEKERSIRKVPCKTVQPDQKFWLSALKSFEEIQCT